MMIVLHLALVRETCVYVCWSCGFVVVHYIDKVSI